jgi:K+-transporting ATPase A subunit
MIMMLAVDNSELLDPRNLIQRSPEWRAERCGKPTIERDRVLRTFVRDRLSRKGGKEQDWKSYGLAMLTFSLAGFVALYASAFAGGSSLKSAASRRGLPDLAFNTSVSFVTNTPETTMSYLTQMAGLTVHNFVSAATGIALAIALIRGFARCTARTVGNFWVV